MKHALLPLLGALGALGVAADAVAGTQVTRQLSVHGETIAFVLHDGVTVDQKCGTSGTAHCLALKALPLLSEKGILPTRTWGGKQPGTVLCADEKGQVVRGYDAHENEIGLCEFKDASLITLEALWAKARANDAARNTTKP